MVQPIAFAALVLLGTAIAFADSGTVKGQLTYKGKVYTPQHVYAWQPPLQDSVLWIYVTDQPLPPAAAQHPSLPEKLAGERRFGGIKLIVHPSKPRLDDIRGAEAQRSAQADVCIAFEQALIEQRLGAAAEYLTAEKLADMVARMQRLGEASFKPFPDQMRRGPQGEERRKQIEQVETKGERAELELRERPGEAAVTVVPLTRTKAGWKIDVRR